ncbi:MAG: glycosyltransferase family 4 protein [Candidatus Levybacteria bacterium]|nr:glycosyltransferase family 4 protein [Candidatus Levybacteria bacterium]
MRIAQLAPPWLSVPPSAYGGTEIIVHYLTEGLVKRGHEVTLFASGDSKTTAKLSYVFKTELGNSGANKKDALHPLLHYIECFDRAGEFDIIHNHAQYYAMFLAHLVKNPVVHTIHGSFSPEYTPEEKIHTLKRFKDHNFISISNSQRNDLPDLNYIATVYNGLDTEEYGFSPEKGKYLLWMGRITSKKGPVDAIHTARRLNIELKIVAAIDPSEEEYFMKQVKPLIDGKLVTFLGEVEKTEKIFFYKNALATLFPISWEEPFGLVMIESLSCGTPVIAYNHGSVPEIIKDGVTGFIINSKDGKAGNYQIKETGIDGLVEGVKRAMTSINRKDCRQHVLNNFTLQQMVDGYEAVYKKILGV